MQLLRLQREVSDLAGELEATKLAGPRIETALREAKRRIEERQLGFRAEAQRELNAVQAEAAALHEVITAEADRVSRTEVRSPVRGTVKRLLVNTVGGVIQPGADLIEIVPLEDNLLVEAKVRPADIAFLHPGQPAMVKVTAYDFAIYGGLDAVVEDISADTITDEHGESFYRVRVRTHDNALYKAGEPLPIIPGMTTQVDILTGEKTVLDYLLKPILRAKERALARALGRAASIVAAWLSRIPGRPRRRCAWGRRARRAAQHAREREDGQKSGAGQPRLKPVLVVRHVDHDRPLGCRRARGLPAPARSPRDWR